MALELNGTTGVSLVQDGVVTAADLASTLDLSGKTVTLPSGVGGKVLNVVYGTYSTDTPINSTNYIDSGLLGVITPTSTSSKILVLIQLAVRMSGTFDHGASFKVERDNNGTTTDIWASAGTLDSYIYANSGSVDSRRREGWVVLDTPNTTNELDYRIYARSMRTDNNNDCRLHQNSTSTITLMEIAG